MRLMVHLALAAVVTAGTATVAHAQGAATRQADVHPNANTEDEIKALEKKFADLIVHDGWDEYEKRLAPEYTRTGSDGKLEKKEDAMAGFRKGPRKVIVSCECRSTPTQRFCRAWRRSGCANWDGSAPNTSAS